MADSIDRIIPILTKGWRQPYGLLTAILLAFGLGTAFISATKPPLAVAVLVIVGSSTAILIAWLLARRLPKTRKGKVGFAVSLWCSDEEAARKVREDFVLSLQRLIKSGRTGRSFQFMEIPSFIAEKVIDHDDAQELRLKTRAHFIIYGRVRPRRIDDSERYFLELDGIVAHKPIAKDVSQLIANEFSELLPRKVLVARENDLLAFQFASEWADVVAKYVIGIAAAVSGDLQYAEGLYSDVRTRIQQIDFPVFVKLRERIPKRLAELSEARAQNAYEMWARTHDDEHIIRLGELLGQHGAEDAARKTPLMLTLSAIYIFLSSRDVAKAIDCLEKIPKRDRDAAWHFNQAFLTAYQGDLKQSTRHYRNGVNYPINPDLIAKVEEFLCRILEDEPDKVQLHYCLGFFNWKIKGDHLQATNDFKKFLELRPANEFQKELELTAQWLKEIEHVDEPVEAHISNKCVDAE